jgi:hypothetical protein
MGAMRARFLTTLLTSSLALEGLATAKPIDEEACMAASGSGQALRKQGKLVDARAQFEVCASQACPDVVKQDCIKWAGDVSSAIPTVSLSAVDASDHDLFDVAVTLDGKLLVSKLDGKAITLDPGIHTFKFETAGAAPVEERVLINEGDRAKRVVARFTALGVAIKPPPVGQASSSGRIPIAPIIVGGFGLAAVATGAILFVSGTSSFPEKCNSLPLFSTSSGSCPRASEAEKVEQSRLAESANSRRDVGGGLMIGGAALAVIGGTWLLIDVLTSSKQSSGLRPFVGWKSAGFAGAF